MSKSYRALIDHGADAGVVLDHGTTPLMLAAAACPLNLPELLIANGAKSTRSTTRDGLHYGLRLTAATAAGYLHC